MLSFKCTENKVHFWSIKKNYLITEPRGPERYRASWQHIWILTQSWPEPFFLPVLISPQQNLIFTFLLLLKLQRKESFFQDFYHFYTAVVRFWDIFILIKADQTIQGSNFLKNSDFRVYEIYGNIIPLHLKKKTLLIFFIHWLGQTQRSTSTHSILENVCKSKNII